MKKYKFAAVLMACLMTAALVFAPMVRAEGDDDLPTIESVQIYKYLVMKKGVTVPGVTFSYTLAPGQAVEGTENTSPYSPAPRARCSHQPTALRLRSASRRRTQ